MVNNINLTIDGIAVSVPANTTILDAAKAAGVNIPTLCYLKEINEIGSCRVCVVEVEGQDKLVASCNNVVTEGMAVRTNTAKVLAARRMNVQLLLSEHNTSCTSCVRGGACSLQKVANDLGILDVPYEHKVPASRWDNSFPLIRDNSKCIKCLRCIQICEKVQTLGVWDVANNGTRMFVNVADGREISAADCAVCGQCITHCPTGALRERDDSDRALAAINNPDKITVVQIAPAVRAAWAEELGLSHEEATVERLVAALRLLGFKYIFDTNFTADLTIMEEGSEFVDKFLNKKEELPLFTSCCPGWVRFMKSQYPDMVKNLSTAKSPQQMFGAVAKSYYAKLLGVDAEKIYSVSVMPCTAKKAECDIPVMNDAGAGQDVDVVLTTREIVRMIKAAQIDVTKLEDGKFDTPLGVGTGAAVIFGTTGGVMEAALRSAYFLVTGENPDADAFREVRGCEGWRESTFEINGAVIRVAVASGLGNARKLIEAIRAGEVQYDFVEIMACPGGCGGGGGQPFVDGEELAYKRGEVLYALDKAAALRLSHENPSVTQIYADYLEKPGSHLAHKLLHTDHEAWQMPKHK